MRILRYTSILLVAVLFAACSNDDATDSNNGKEVQVRFTMATRASSGIGTPENPVEALQVERFNRYWVVFTDGTASNKIVAIVKNTCELTERDEFTVSLSPGAYKAYAFANISDAYLASLGIVEGNTMPDLSGTLFTPDNRFFGNGVTTLVPVEAFQADYATNAASGFTANPNLGIPMTSVNGQTVNITNAVTVTTSIEVVRMFAKLEFVFGNNTATDLTLRSQSVSNLSVNRTTGGFIPLYNDDLRGFDFLNSTPFKTLTHSYGAGLNLPQGTSGVSKSFYVLESKADDITNSFVLDFDVVKKGEAPTAVTDYMRYALTDPNTLTAIRRNDWIRIPVTFTDWQMRLEARTYPPIGGYPEAEIEETESNEFVVKFDGGGDFSIRPFIRKFNDGDNWFGIDNTSKVIVNNLPGMPAPAPGTESPVITVTDTDGIFLTAPHLTATGEIRGRMKVASGKHATITLTARVITSTSPLMTKLLTRKIFITQK